MAFADYQNELYDQSLHGNQPQYPIRFEDLEEKAAAMTPKVLQYVAGGAGDEHTQRANCAAFKRWGLYPRMGIAPEQRDMSVELFGMRFPSPIFMAPIGVIGVCDPDGHGDILCARASVRTGVPFFVGTLTSDPMEDVAAELGEDVRRAKDIGVDGIYCSNHGGRQANGGLPCLDCLPDVIEAADPMPVLFDSGVRGGADVIKALALGATAVGIGRPYAYGLALGGVDGIVHVLRSLLAEADLIMAVDGYPSLKDLTPEALRPVGHVGADHFSHER